MLTYEIEDTPHLVYSILYKCSCQGEAYLALDTFQSEGGLRHGFFESMSFIDNNSPENKC